MSKIPPKTEAYYNAQTNAIIAQMQESNRHLAQMHSGETVQAVQGNAALHSGDEILQAVMGNAAPPPIGAPTIPAPGEGYTWTLTHTAGGPVEGWVFTGIKATPEQIAAINEAEKQLVAAKKALGLA